jgi:3-oxoacyl-[acyl-carrier-protein] synthase II
MSDRTRVVITGTGWVTPLGHDRETVWRRLLAGDSGMSATRLFEASTFPTTFSAQVENFDVSPYGSVGRNTAFALHAAEQAMRESGIGDAVDPWRFGVYLGCGEGSLDYDAYTAAILAACENGSFDAAAWTRVAAERMERVREHEQEPNLPLFHVAKACDARGPGVNCLTACAASCQAAGEATEMIRLGEADAVLVGGAHSMIHPLGVTGFNRLTALSQRNDEPQKASRPFDADRGGFVLGEGAGMLVLESAEHAAARGATPLAEIVGYGSTADAFRVTDQHPEGEGAVRAMQAALDDAGVPPEQVDYINAHGTGTKENDSTETAAIKKVLGERARDVPVSSIKSMMGHLIAASGAVELIACVLALRDRTLPPTINLDRAGPECDLDYVPNAARKVARLDVVLTNNFGFGGQNDTLVIRRV